MKEDRQKLFEIGAVVLTGLLKFVMMDYLEWRFVYIASAILFWASYLYWRHRQDAGILTEWGFRREEFKTCFMQLLPWAVVSIALFAFYGYWTGRMIWSWHLLPILLLYPIWGVIQQFLVIALVAGNLDRLERRTVSKIWIMVITAAIFGLVHFPSILLVIGTTLLALVYTHFYLRYKNLWPLGLYHGWLGAFFFYFVLERDVFAEVFQFI